MTSHLTPKPGELWRATNTRLQGSVVVLVVRPYEKPSSWATKIGTAKCSSKRVRSVPHGLSSLYGA